MITELRKPFDIALWGKGWPIEARDGRTAEIEHVYRDLNSAFMKVKIDGNYKDWQDWRIDGSFAGEPDDSISLSGTSSVDLFMRPIFECKGRDVYPGDTLFNLAVMNMPQLFSVDDYKMASQFNHDSFSWEKPEEKTPAEESRKVFIATYDSYITTAKFCNRVITPLEDTLMSGLSDISNGLANNPEVIRLLNDSHVDIKMQVTVSEREG